VSSRPARLRHVVLPLARPQYVSLPEALSSALVWSRYERDISTVRNDGKSAKLALMYDAGTNAQKELKTLVYRETRPDRSSARLLGFSEALSAAGLECDGGAELLASAVGTSILGLRSTKSPNQQQRRLAKPWRCCKTNRAFLEQRNLRAWTAFFRHCSILARRTPLHLRRSQTSGFRRRSFVCRLTL